MKPISGLFAAAVVAPLMVNSGDPAATGPARQEPRGIWGAIAYSPATDRHGFFWGADRQADAVERAISDCRTAHGTDCHTAVVILSDLNGNDAPAARRWHCAAYAVGRPSTDGLPSWGAAAAPTRREAEHRAIHECGGEENQCRIHEWVCT
ncbi:DUF4189 domain-containing protein [Ciceribacter sp. RN22]|uniref:DUF4189 domain-containing protein n=1 Tax=Ciceribacter sp. RN22 TaxID=2954932 RepID=UPI002092F756|nr:DUF4189 domain-containing protein [Ciceribacter sp. RN22]MCO6180966.1 DUF4189 domain-containing protein [Ciceribacter sp. RN22]